MPKLPRSCRAALCLLWLACCVPLVASALTLQRIVVTGNSALPVAALEAVTADYLNRPLKDEHLQELRRRLEGLFAEAGYRSTRVTFPDQTLARGELRVEVVEAIIEDVIVQGTVRLDPDFLARRITRGLGKPVDIRKLDDNLRLLRLEQLVERVKAEFRPGSAPDRQILVVSVEEAPSFSLGFRVGNDRSPVVGSYAGTVEGAVRNLTGRGDEVGVAHGSADGLRSIEFRLRAPLNSLGTELVGRYLDYESSLVEEQFAVLGAGTEMRGAEAGLTHPLWRSVARQITVGGRYTQRWSESFLLGEPFSFSPEADNGRVRVEAARFHVQWLERGARDVLSLRYQLSAGIGGTKNAYPVPDAHFVSSLVQAQWLHVFSPRTGQLFVRGDFQFTGQPLVSMERFSVGGLGSVRGYRRSLDVTDNGWSASIEYRYPVLRLALPGSAEGDGQLWALAFVDAGRGWNDLGADEPLLLAAGPGVRWDATRKIRAELHWGGLRRRLSGVPNEDLQDDGLHFMVSARVGF